MDDKEKYSHLRVLRTTQENLRLAAAIARKSGIELLDEIVKKELERLERERQNKH